MKLSKLYSMMVLLLTLLMLLLSTTVALADLNKAKEHFNAGVKSKADGDVDAAVLAYKGAIIEDPSYVDPYINLGAIYFDRKNYEGAKEMFSKATEADATNAEAFANLGRVSYKLNLLVEAEAAFNSALGLSSANSEYLKELGKVQYRKKNYKEMVVTLTKCHDNGGGDHLTWFMLGKGEDKQDNKTDAIAAFKKSIALKSDNYNSNFALGQIYLGQTKYKSASTSFDKAIKQAKKNKKYRAAYNYAIAIESSDPEAVEANIAAWERFIGIAQNNAKARNQLAEAKSHLKELRELKEAKDLQ